MTEQTESLNSRLARRDGATIAELHDLMLDPFIALGAAARGDLEAQRKLALVAWTGAVEHDEETGVTFTIAGDEMIEQALTFSRFAAAHGTMEDVRLLAVRLVAAAELCPEHDDDRMAEAIGWLLWAEDVGLGDTALCLAAAVDLATPDAVERGRGFHATMLANLPHEGVE